MNEWFDNCYILSNNHVNNNITENNNQSSMICDLFDNKFFFDNLENFDFEYNSNNSNKESVNDSNKNKDQEEQFLKLYSYLYMFNNFLWPGCLTHLLFLCFCYCW